MLSLIVTLGFALVSQCACETAWIEATTINHQNHLIEVAGLNFGLAVETLNRYNIATISVNNELVTFTTVDCRTMTKSLTSLDPEEEALLVEARDYIYGQSGSHIESHSRDMNRLIREENNVVRFETDTFSASIKDLMPDPTLARIYVRPNVVGFVYLDRRIDMKPKHCLNQLEQTMINTITGAVRNDTNGVNMI